MRVIMFAQPLPFPTLPPTSAMGQSFPNKSCKIAINYQVKVGKISVESFCTNKTLEYIIFQIQCCKCLSLQNTSPLQVLLLISLLKVLKHMENDFKNSTTFLFQSTLYNILCIATSDFTDHFNDLPAHHTWMNKCKKKTIHSNWGSQIVQHDCFLHHCNSLCATSTFMGHFPPQIAYHLGPNKMHIYFGFEYSIRL